MRRIKVLSLTGPDTSDLLRAGELKPEKGQGVKGLRLKFTLKVANANATTDKAIAAADRVKILDSFRLNLKYAKDGKRLPYKDLSLKVIRTLQRWAFNADVFGWGDTVTGLAQTVVKSTSATVVFHIIVPTCQLWMIPEFVGLLAMGRSQCATVEAELKWISGVALSTADLSIDATQKVQVEVYPEIEPVKTDRFAWLPEYTPANVRDFRQTYSDGLPLLLSEGTEPHDLTDLTKINVKVGEHEIQRDVSPHDSIAPYREALGLTDAEDVSDTVTVLYSVQPGMKAANVPAGPLFIEQPNNDLANMQLGYFAIPPVGEAEVLANVQHIATSLRTKEIKAVIVTAAAGVEIPEELQGFMPFSIYDAQDSEYERFPGLGCVPGGVPEVKIPTSGLGRLGAAVGAHMQHGERRAAVNLLKQSAKFVPGAAFGSSGFTGSSTMAALAKAVGIV